MIEYLESIDIALVQLVNGWNTPFLDELMWIISGKITWIPLYAFLILLAIRQSGWKAGSLFLLCAVLSVILADFVSTQCLKEVIQRYRPSHNLAIQDHLHYYQIGWGDFYKGGTYGFVSSHAANFFAIAIFSISFLIDYKKWLNPLLIFIAVLVSFSRIYLGVHYFSDVFVGGLVGTLIAYLVYHFIFLNLHKKLIKT
ncbi:MAG: phosphatase PAP2 family protein [Fluviicola sp.]|nr:MAG: phosphatase PAP2 family protein [Fluviicola sp.]